MGPDRKTKIPESDFYFTSSRGQEQLKDSNPFTVFQITKCRVIKRQREGECVCGRERGCVRERDRNNKEKEYIKQALIKFFLILLY